MKPFDSKTFSTHSSYVDMYTAHPQNVSHLYHLFLSTPLKLCCILIIGLAGRNLVKAYCFVM